MNWETFNSGEIDITNVGQVLTDIRCPECGRLIFMDTTKTLTTYPPQYGYWCNCGWHGTSYRSWLTQRPFKARVVFDTDEGAEALATVFAKDVINGFYGVHANTCEDCELFVTPTEPIRGIYCARAQRFVCQHNPACKDFEPQTKEAEE